MATFAVIVDKPNEKLNHRITKVFDEDDCFKVNDRMWFVSSSVTTPKEVFSLLSIDPETNESEGNNAFGRILVTASNAYWGFHDNQLWPWLRAKGGG